MLSTFGAFGVMAASVWALGASISAERALGWLQLKRASPMPPLAYFVAKAVAALAFSSLVVTALLVLAAAFGGVRMGPAAWLALGVSLIAGAIPFCAFGFMLGYLVGPGSAPAILNLVVMTISFCSGLWTPLEFLPAVVHRFAVALPAYHLAQLGFLVSGLPSSETLGSHVQALFAFTLVFAGMGAIVWRREENKVYG
jgi:ABC-2 type transport system permease protein